MEELRKMVCDLTLALSEARTSATHYKLQFNMLQMESRETQNRMAVELDMAHREVDVLQAAEERRKHEHASPAQTAAEVNSAHALLNDMTAQCSQLQHENARLHEVVASMDHDLLHRTGEIDDKTAEIKRLLMAAHTRKLTLATFSLLDPIPFFAELALWASSGSTRRKKANDILQIDTARDTSLNGTSTPAAVGAIQASAARQNE